MWRGLLRRNASEPQPQPAHSRAPDGVSAEGMACTLVEKFLDRIPVSYSNVRVDSSVWDNVASSKNRRLG